MALGLRCFRGVPSGFYHCLSAVAKPLPEAQLRAVTLTLTNYRECVANQLIQTRHFATKKAKAKGKGQAQARVNLNAALVEDIINLEEVNRDLQTVMEALKEDFNKNLNIRTSAGALDHISVPTEDGKFSLNQLAQISMKSPQLVLVNMANFPECTAAAIKAIRESGMNLNPEVDGTIIRVPIPKVTREHREMLVKLAKQNTNKAKESLRKVRTNAMSKLKKSKDKVAEDTIRLIEKKIGQMADDKVAEMDKQLSVKTKELLG
ncbi:ribosome-recycling factor, mitochondrial [Tachyglossus aculeatus]|uniref:ribosome-recycling factor, mitochondrial n=1 Tax=Tachyglossus aculeatus TaxID=9261 RepID=UPI0018F74746|nr:ribosome-recycling factor, mitochondrial [Tachyglossus aculeatus]